MEKLSPGIGCDQAEKNSERWGQHRSRSQIRLIYCGCTGGGQIFRSFSGKVEKGRQLRSQAFGVLTYSVYAPRAKSPAALLDSLFEHSPFSLNSPTIRLKRSKHLTQTSTPSQRSLIWDRLLGAPGKIQKCLLTTEVTTTFCISPCTPISCTSFLRPTAVSRIKVCLQAGLP